MFSIKTTLSKVFLMIEEPSDLRRHLLKALEIIKELKNKVHHSLNKERTEAYFLLKTKQIDQAKHYVQHVCEKMDMFDAVVMIEGYCDVLIENETSITKRKSYSIEVKEAIAGIMYATLQGPEFPFLRPIYYDFINNQRIASMSPKLSCSRRLREKLSSIHPDDTKRKEVLAGICVERGMTEDDLRPSSPEIVESCKRCNRIK